MCVVVPAYGNWRITYGVIAQESSPLRLCLSPAWKSPDECVASEHRMASLVLGFEACTTTLDF